MGSAWLRNLAGFSLDEGELKGIPYPELELNCHVTLKCVEAFGVLGTLVFGPLAGLTRKSTRNFKDIVRSSTKFGKYGVIAGIFVGPAMTYGRMKAVKADREAFYDRAYRIRHNRNQVRVDRAFFIGLFSGATIFPIALKMCPIYGGLFGMSLGVISMGIYNNVIAQ